MGLNLTEKGAKSKVTEPIGHFWPDRHEFGA
jgi:hypothetical protein